MVQYIIVIQKILIIFLLKWIIGMFNNANVLFKTSFIDGLSKVDRT
jgi:hypothetical protein